MLRWCPLSVWLCCWNFVARSLNDRDTFTTRGQIWSRMKSDTTAPARPSLQRERTRLRAEGTLMFTPRRRTENPRHRWPLTAEGTGPRRDCHNQCGMAVERTGHTHTKATLASDSNDPRRNNGLHRVLETGTTSSKLSESTSKGNFQGDRIQL